MIACGAGASKARPTPASMRSRSPWRSTGDCCPTSWRWIAPGPRPLKGAKILNAEEVQQTLAALDRIAARAAKDKQWLDSSDAEDVHHFVEKALVEELGALGWKLHTGRSRNELVATDFRMFVKEAAAGTKRRSRTASRIRCAGKRKSAPSHGWNDAHAACPAHSGFPFLVGACRSVSQRPRATRQRDCLRRRLPDGLGRVGRLLFRD